MNLKKIYLAVVALSAMYVGVMASVADLPVKTVNGKKYHYYTVQPKESLYSLSHKLGISRDDIVKFNPDAADGLKAYEDLLFPVADDEPARSVLSSDAAADVVAATYEVKRGDTVYGLCRRYGISREEFLKLNPDAVDGLKAGAIVRLRNAGSDGGAMNSKPAVDETDVAADARQLPDTAAHSTQITHTIRDGETLYHISKEYGTTVDAILAANPELDVTDYQMGMMIVIPENKAAVENSGSSPTEPVDSAPATELLEADTVGISGSGKITIAVALPFKLAEAQSARMDKVYTEFYKGFLLAVDSMRHCGTPIKIMAFDTSDSMDSVRKVLSDPLLEQAQVIIAPGDVNQLNAFAGYGKQHKIPVLNLFHVKDISYRINDVMMQGNIPHEKMYEKAADYLINDLHGATPVIIKSRDAASDKSEFVGMLMSRLGERNIVHREIVFDEQLAAKDLEVLEGAGSYIFIPVTGKSEELTKMLPALIDFKKENVDPSGIRLFGYPEWTTFRGDIFAKMQDMGTMVFSRFYTVPEDDHLKRVEEVFTRWYGAPMASLVPRQGLFGFDTGMYLINALRVNHGDFDRFTPQYDGVQNGFDFLRSPGGGYVNNELYIINFRTDGEVEKVSL